MHSWCHYQKCGYTLLSKWRLKFITIVRNRLRSTDFWSSSWFTFAKFTSINLQKAFPYPLKASRSWITSLMRVNLVNSKNLDHLAVFWVIILTYLINAHSLPVSIDQITWKHETLRSRRWGTTRARTSYRSIDQFELVVMVCSEFGYDKVKFRFLDYLSETSDR